MVDEIAKRNWQFLDYMHPKMEMMLKWANDIDGTRSQMARFMEIMKEQLKEDSTGPYQAFNAIIEEALQMAKSKRKD